MESFYIQPAGGLFCGVLVVVGVFSFIMAVFGVKPRFLRRFFEEVKVRYLILAIVIIVSLGWIVNLARVFAEKS